MSRSPWQRARGLLKRALAPAARRARPADRAAGRTGADDLARWKELKAATQGMLDPKVYRELYRLAVESPDLDIIEIGGAAGAGSVALARGLVEAGKAASVIVVEKLEGGSRTELGARDDNIRRIESNFETHGVAHKVRLFPHELTFENGHEVVAMVATADIAALVHDADGRVDRDFFLFWPLLRDGGAIVIDDYADAPENYRPISPRYPLGGAKGVVTYRLTNQLIAWGLFEPTLTMGNTLFGTKPAAADWSRFDRAACERIVAGVARERDEALARAAGSRQDT